MIFSSGTTMRLAALWAYLSHDVVRIEKLDTKLSKHRHGLFAAAAAISLVSACAPESACVMIDDPVIAQALNEAVRPKVEYHVKSDNYTHTLEKELSQTLVAYADCGSHYTVTFTPHSYDPELVAIGATYTYTGTDAEDATADLQYRVRLDGGAWSSPMSDTTYQLTGLSEGAHTFEVAARDTGGVDDPTPASASFEVDFSGGDTTPPETPEDRD